MRTQKTVLCRTKTERKNLTASLQEAGILPLTGQIVINVQDGRVAEVFATAWKFNKAKEVYHVGDY